MPLVGVVLTVPTRPVTQPGQAVDGVADECGEYGRAAIASGRPGMPEPDGAVKPGGELPPGGCDRGDGGDGVGPAVVAVEGAGGGALDLAGAEWVRACGQQRGQNRPAGGPVKEWLP
jgi:hypothetical protein